MERFILAFAAVAALASSVFGAEVIYETDFNSLQLGQTQPFPGVSGQDGWYSELADGDALGEIQDAFANGGRALHEFAPAANDPGLQTIDARPVGPIDLSMAGQITLSVDFYANTSDLGESNVFDAGFAATGGPHPGFEIIGFGLGGGHFVPKSETGVNVTLGAFSSVDENNVPIPLTVGQNLEWDAWHSLSLTIDHFADRYVSLTVDGATQDLSGYQPLRSDDGSEWLRGQLIDLVSASCIPGDVGGTTSTDDHVYWDNLSLTMAVIPEPSTLLIWSLFAGLGIAVRRWRRKR
jgi:hypothetical protein